MDLMDLMDLALAEALHLTASGAGDPIDSYGGMRCLP